jgi:hypothetical protein
MRSQIRDTHFQDFRERMPLQSPRPLVNPQLILEIARAINANPSPAQKLLKSLATAVSLFITSAMTLNIHGL